MVRTCENCGGDISGRSSLAKTCSDGCRTAAMRARKSGVVPAVSGDVSTVSRVRAELESVGRLDSWRGAAALALAERIDSATAVMGFAALVKQLEATMVAATAGAATVADPLDELKDWRDRKRAG